MNSVVLFWCSAGFLLACASACVLVPLYAARQHVIQQHIVAATGILTLLVLFSMLVYKNLGLSQDLNAYYSAATQRSLKSHALLRPLYTKLQRELVKSNANLEFDLDNAELILQFAQLQSQAQNGLLPPATQDLLHALLKAIPQQVTALNLLAVHAYKTQHYTLAIEYWQAILRQFTPAMRKTETYKILQNKINETRTKVSKA